MGQSKPILSTLSVDSVDSVDIQRIISSDPSGQTQSWGSEAAHTLEESKQTRMGVLSHSIRMLLFHWDIRPILYQLHQRVHKPLHLLLTSLCYRRKERTNYPHKTGVWVSTDLHCYDIFSGGGQ